MPETNHTSKCRWCCSKVGHSSEQVFLFDLFAQEFFKKKKKKKLSLSLSSISLFILLFKKKKKKKIKKAKKKKKKKKLRSLYTMPLFYTFFSSTNTRTHLIHAPHMADCQQNLDQFLFLFTVLCTRQTVFLFFSLISPENSCPMSS